MNKDTLIYIRCVFANKYTLFGYCSAIISVALATFSVWYPLDTHMRTAVSVLLLSSLISSFATLFVTELGMPTYRQYYKALRHIERFGEVQRYLDRLTDIYADVYCVVSGIRLAANDCRVNFVYSGPKPSWDI